MLRLLKIALRNVFRNRWRSAVSALVVFVGVTLIVFLQGFINGLLENTIQDAALAKLGAIQIHRKGYLDAERDPLKLDLPATGELLAKVRAVPGVAAVTPRLTFEGMLGNGATQSMFLATAIDPASEYAVCPKRREQVADGQKPLEVDSGGAALIGQQLVESLGAKPGHTLTVVSASQNGAQNALDIQVQGYLKTRIVLESKRLATVPLAFSQELLRMPGRATELAVAVTSLDQTDLVAARLREAVGPEYEVHTWRDLSPMARDMVVRMKVVLLIISVVLFLLVGTGIGNTMLMSISERVREIGTMLAVGTRRYQVMLLFLVEAATLGLVGGAIGAALGTGLVEWFGHRGITFDIPGGSRLVFFPFVSASFVALVVAAATVAAIVAALYPARKGSRLSPVEALRSN